MTYIGFTGAAMHRSNHRRRVRRTPSRHREFVCLPRIGVQQVFYLARLFLQRERGFEEVHLVILVPDLVRKAARPCLDLVEPVVVFVVSRLANVHSLVPGKSSWSSAVVSCNVHHKTSVLDLIDVVVAVTARLDDLVLPEVLVESMYRLLGSVVPTHIQLLLPRHI